MSYDIYCAMCFCNRFFVGYPKEYYDDKKRFTNDHFGVKKKVHDLSKNVLQTKNHLFIHIIYNVCVCVWI